eukprot:CAMPEP_0118928454 /NCGR_PEP_ID=MMETSP1169-20130426/5703_1 /TAXON_ID=36882 /ORGANISM="Pyramimonas obovata, Strain CCMP722" /LENGTH=243 /DNA_ID=CAMNT_0006870429 /DNA_START=77 /DNA_END=808 /DNA_ORIENTATION=-
MPVTSSIPLMTGRVLRPNCVQLERLRKSRAVDSKYTRQSVVCRCSDKSTVDVKPSSDVSRRNSLIGVSSMVGTASYGFLNPSANAGIVSSFELNERTIVKSSSGIQYTDLYVGSGEAPKVGTLVAAHIKAEFEGGPVFLDTREAGAPLVWTVGIQNPLVTEGLEEAVLGMRLGGRRLATVPPSLAYKDAGLPGPLFGRIGKGKDVYYNIELLRCLKGSKGLVCCAEEAYPCKEPELPELPNKQ